MKEFLYYCGLINHVVITSQGAYIFAGFFDDRHDQDKCLDLALDLNFDLDLDVALDMPLDLGLDWTWVWNLTWPSTRT